MAVPKWNGEPKTYSMFMMRFKVYAMLKCFSLTLVSGGEKDLPVAEDVPLTTSEEDKKKQAAIICNNIVMSCFTMVFSTEKAMRYVMLLMTDKWPGGLAHQVVSKIKKIHAPTDMMSDVEMQ